jgi:hypothetical protein
MQAGRLSGAVNRHWNARRFLWKWFALYDTASVKNWALLAMFASGEGTKDVRVHDSIICPEKYCKCGEVCLLCIRDDTVDHLFEFGL